MKTKHHSFIPMSPELLPRQKLNEVVGLPPRPEGLDVKIEWEHRLKKEHPKGSPRKLTFVCSAEWSWSPAHHRIANYYLNPKRKYWFLWNNWVDDQTYPWAWHWDVLAYAPRIEADECSVAAYMLLEHWQSDAEHGHLDQYHWINNTGCLSVEDIQAVAREIW